MQRKAYCRPLAVISVWNTSANISKTVWCRHIVFGQLTGNHTDYRLVQLARSYRFHVCKLRNKYLSATTKFFVVIYYSMGCLPDISVNSHFVSPRGLYGISNSLWMNVDWIIIHAKPDCRPVIVHFKKSSPTAADTSYINFYRHFHRFTALQSARSNSSVPFTGPHRTS